MLTDQPIDFGEKGYIGLKGDTEPNFLSIHRTMGQYLRDEREIALCANSLELADGDLRREEEETETEGMTLA